MEETLMQPYRVYEEGLRVVKYFQRGGKVVN
jgi:hypothetical protein